MIDEKIMLIETGQVISSTLDLRQYENHDIDLTVRTTYLDQAHTNIDMDAVTLMDRQDIISNILVLKDIYSDTQTQETRRLSTYQKVQKQINNRTKTPKRKLKRKSPDKLM